MKIKVRKEVVRCVKCKEHNEFLYLSDFSYGERLVLYDNGCKYAYINILEDKVYADFVEKVALLLKTFANSTDKLYIQKVVENIFYIACDEIEGSKISMSCDRKCINCGSVQFEDLLVKPEAIEQVDLLVITHNNWINLSDNQQRSRIITAIKDM